MQKYIKLLALLSLAILVPAVSLKNINKIGVYALTGPGPSVTPTPTIVLTPPVVTTPCGLGKIDFLGQCKRGFEKATYNCKLGNRIIYSGSVGVANACSTRDELKTQANRVCIAMCNKRLDTAEITFGL